MSIISLSNCLACVFSFLLLDACNTSKAINASSKEGKPGIILVELEEDLTSKYFSKNYSNFAISKILKVNKTKNQYSITYIGEREAYVELVDIFKKDKNIVDIQLSEDQTKDRMNATNDKKAKARPKTKN